MESSRASLALHYARLDSAVCDPQLLLGPEATRKPPLLRKFIPVAKCRSRALLAGVDDRGSLVVEALCIVLDEQPTIKPLHYLVRTVLLSYIILE